MDSINIQSNNSTFFANNEITQLGGSGGTAGYGWPGSTPSASTPNIIIGNEFSNNNTVNYAVCDDAGGGWDKVAGSDTIQAWETFKNNYVHDNYGPGW